jgi:hypothetical protein
MEPDMDPHVQAGGLDHDCPEVAKRLGGYLLDELAGGTEYLVVARDLHIDRALRLAAAVRGAEATRHARDMSQELR